MGLPVDPRGGARDPAEPDDAWQAFLAYRALPPSSRSLDRLIGPGRSRMTLRRWSARFGWQARVRTYDGGPQVVRTSGTLVGIGGGTGADVAEGGSPNLNKEGAAVPGAEPQSSAHVCTDDLDEAMEARLRAELAKPGHDPTALAKLRETLEQHQARRRARAAADQTEYDLSRLSDERAAMLREILAEARVA